jgi:hypothetical protein
VCFPVELVLDEFASPDFRDASWLIIGDTQRKARAAKIAIIK